MFNLFWTFKHYVYIYYNPVCSIFAVGRLLCRLNNLWFWICCFSWKTIWIDHWLTLHQQWLLQKVLAGISKKRTAYFVKTFVRVQGNFALSARKMMTSLAQGEPSAEQSFGIVCVTIAMFVYGACKFALATIPLPQLLLYLHTSSNFRDKPFADKGKLLSSPS